MLCFVYGTLTDAEIADSVAAYVREHGIRVRVPETVTVRMMSHKVVRNQF